MNEYLFCFIIMLGGAGHKFGDAIYGMPGESVGLSKIEIEAVRKDILGKNLGATQVIFTSVNKLTPK